MATEPESATPVGQGGYTVQPGDTMTSIAFDRGFHYETIWKYGDNAELREKRKLPHVLLPGDRVAIPELRKRVLQLPTTRLHRFRLRGTPPRIRIVVRDVENRPMTGKRYELKAGSLVYRGATGGDGGIDHFVEPKVHTGELTVWPETPFYPEEFRLALRVSYLEPVESVKGLQARLINLGFHCADEYGEIGPATERAIGAFQKANDLEVTGRPDAETQRKLSELYPS